MTSGSSGTETDKADGSARRRSRSVRFQYSEWERIEVFAEARGLTSSEFVRYAALTATADRGEATGPPGAADRDDVSCNAHHDD